MFEEDGHLFMIPPVAAAVAAADPEFSADFDSNGAGLDALETVRILEAVMPAVRAVKLAGYRAWKLEMGPDADNRIEVRFGEEITVSPALGATDDAFWTSGNAEFTVLIHTFPYHAPHFEHEENEPDFFPHKLPVPGSSGQWASFGPTPASSAERWPDLPDQEWEVFQLALISIDPAKGLCGSLADGPVQDLVDDFVPALATAFNAGPGTESRGLVWLFDPETWMRTTGEDGELLDENRHQRVMKKIGAHALLPAGSANLEDFFGQQCAGDMKADAVLLAATNKKIRSRSRARRFIKHIRKWSESDDSPMTPFPDYLDLAIETLGWLDLLFALVETGFLTPPALPDTFQVILGEGGGDGVFYEPLIAEQHDDLTVFLRVFASDGNPDFDDNGETDNYATVVRMTAGIIPLPDPDNIDATIGARSIQSMCTWEYIPANAEVTTPQLLIVAGPGVQIELTDSPLVNAFIIRKQDYGLPVWGAPIQGAELLAPIVVPGIWPESLAGHVSKEPAWIIKPREAGMDIHLFRDLPGAAAGVDIDQIEVSPEATIEITLTDPLSGNAGFRVECDFACLEASDGSADWEPVHIESTRPILRFWQTADGVQTKVTENWSTDFDGQFWEHADLAAVLSNFPHAVPTTVPALWWLEGRGDQMDLPVDDSNEVRNPETLTPQMTVQVADLQARGFTRIADDDPSLIFEYQWTAIDWFLIPVDILIGFTPVGNVIDVVEFVYAYNTGLDKWGRPVTEMDLWMMGIGAAVPIAGSAVFRNTADAGGALGRIWIPPAGADGDVAKAIVDATRGAGKADEVPFSQTTKASESVASALVGALPRILAEGSDAAASTGLKAIDLLNSAGDAFTNPELQRAYRRWVAEQLSLGG